MLKNKKILITGATGFIGSNLVRSFLREGADIAIFTRPTSDKWRIKDILQEISEYSVDLLDTAQLEKAVIEIKPEIIFHTAVYGGYPFQSEAKRILETNLNGTNNLLNACKKIDFELLVNAGSSSEYGIKSSPMKEEDVLEPRTVYASSKTDSTLACQEFAKREKKAVVTLRLFSPYGYYEEPTRLIQSVIISCLKKENPRVSSPNAVRDFIFIEDVVSAYLKAVENKDKIGREVFNIGSGKQYSVVEVVEKIIKLTGNEVKSALDNAVNPRYEPKMWQAEISKSKSMLNWLPRYELIQGLEKTINWLKQNYKTLEEYGPEKIQKYS